MKTIRTLLCLSVAALAATAFSACSHSHDDDDHSHDDAGAHTSPYPSCNEITQACHKYDTGDNVPIHDCHELAHAAKGDGDCAPKKDECLKICAAAGADAGSTDGGGGDAEEHHEHDE
jgi:hypothetical protein